MRTALISDLHLGLVSQGDLLRSAKVREALLEEIAANAARAPQGATAPVA